MVANVFGVNPGHILILFKSITNLFFRKPVNVSALGTNSSYVKTRAHCKRICMTAADQIRCVIKSRQLKRSFQQIRLSPEHTHTHTPFVHANKSNRFFVPSINNSVRLTSGDKRAAQMAGGCLRNQETPSHQTKTSVTSLCCRPRGALVSLQCNHPLVSEVLDGLFQ